MCPDDNFEEVIRAGGKRKIKMISISETPLGYGTIGSGALQSAVALTTILVGGVVGIPAGANIALLQVDTANVRFRDDGVPPTASVGMQLASALLPFEYSGNLGALQFIAVSGNPILNVSFYKRAG
jgi:hypothetical protein